MKKPENLSPFVKDVIYGLDHGLFDDDVGQHLLEIFRAGVCDDRIREMIHGRAARHRVHQALSGTPFRTGYTTEQAVHRRPVAAGRN